MAYACLPGVLGTQWTSSVRPPEDAVFAIIAAILFGLALLLDLANAELGEVINIGTLTLAGFLFLALQFAGLGAYRGRWANRRRR
jgi:hypothetical protein